MARLRLLGEVFALVWCALSSACGGGWSDADAKSAANAARDEVMLEGLCSGSMPCRPEQVRALERAAYCANASMLARHGALVPDAGIACQPQ